MFAETAVIAARCAPLRSLRFLQRAAVRCGFCSFCSALQCVRNVRPRATACDRVRPRATACDRVRRRATPCDAVRVVVFIET